MNITAWLFETAALLLSCLREIFDESAYVRFLRQHRMPASPESYADFCQEQAAAKSRRLRCC